MTLAFDHGPRLPDAEFDRRIVALQEGLPPEPSRAQLAAVRRAEFELGVAHRLGTRFPPERLEALWKAQERIARRTGRLLLWSLLERAWRGLLSRRAQGAASAVVREYASVLAPAELEAYLGADEVRAPGLPDDRG